jgi:hypothetical protein
MRFAIEVFIVLPTEADNTVRESKNQIMFKYHSVLVKKKIRTMIQLHMTVGHTHDRIGTCLSRLAHRPLKSTPRVS